MGQRGNKAYLSLGRHWNIQEKQAKMKRPKRMKIPREDGDLATNPP